MPKVLVVEDDVSTAKALCNWLETELYTVEVATDGSDGCQLLRTYEYDLVILDISLPSMNGLEVLRDFRLRGGKTPVILLTGQGALDDKVAGLDGGADDYIVKPVDLRELSARMRTILRRPAVPLQGTLRVGDLALDPSTASVCVNGEAVSLTGLQYSLLHFLMSNADQFFSADALLDRVWRSDVDASALTVKVCVQRIRSKIDKPGEPSFIESSRGFGYRVVSHREERSN